MVPSHNSFVGTGWHWPVQVDATGAMATVTGVEQLEQAMYLVLSTEPGERPMRPEFGARLRQFVFASADATTASFIAAEARRALTRWEPRVVVEEIAVTSDSDDPCVLLVDVTYTVRTTNSRRNLVFPFYVLPGEEQSVPHPDDDRPRQRERGADRP